VAAGRRESIGWMELLSNRCEIQAPAAVAWLNPAGGIVALAVATAVLERSNPSPHGPVDRMSRA